MGRSDQNHPRDEIERLRHALDEETRRRLEIQRQLDRANSGFEEFVSTAAHNLRESLRDVVSFSQLMAETYTGRLDSDADVFLERIRAGAVNMQSLLADIVDYWTTDTSGRRLSRTDMEAVLSQALLSTNRHMTERSAVVTHDPLPSVTGDFEMLTKVLRHLIGNAIEYCVAASPRVHISSRREESEWVFSVRDNGPGVDPEFHGRLFLAFKPLHGKEHPGSGLGLAFCKKVIEWHGGRMWLESKTGEGSTFFFTLPSGD
jgi:light-regulated signal transduction histidine kinase (bacteriophytochrome)